MTWLPPAIAPIVLRRISNVERITLNHLVGF
jgi:hypothetical protein